MKSCYVAIDLKSFFASVECVSRGLNPLDTNLVVADSERTEKTICLAVTPSLKAYGLGGRPRLFEVVQRMRDVNTDRLQRLQLPAFRGKSVSDKALRQHPDWQIDYIVATPRMALYEKYSLDIYAIYLDFVAEDSIHVYSCDEVFIDLAPYLRCYKCTPRELASRIVQEVYRRTGITATVGIGTNLYLAKVAMDVLAKRAQPDEQGVRMAQLDERTYREQLWDHKPITDFWRVGRGTANRLLEYGVDTMGKLARLSHQRESVLYKHFGVNAETLIDHAWGWEPCTIADIKAYRPASNSFCRGQVLHEPYTYEMAKVVTNEMAFGIAMELFAKHLETDRVTLTVGYDSESLNIPQVAARYRDRLERDHYGRLVPRAAHGTVNLERRTALSSYIIKAALDIFQRTVDPELLVRRITITTDRVVPEDTPLQHKAEDLQLDLFDDNETLLRQEAERSLRDKKERSLQATILAVNAKFGPNALFRGIDLSPGATALERNKQKGGHKA